MRLTKKQREELRQRYDGRCAYCGDELGHRWHADHADPVYRHSVGVRCPKTKRWVLKQTGTVHHEDRDSFENLMPSCASCNIYKSVDNVEQFRRRLELTVESAQQYACVKFAKKYGLIKETGARVVFFFEQFQEAP